MIRPRDSGRLGNPSASPASPSLLQRDAVGLG